MRFINRQSILGLVVGMAVAFIALAVHAYDGGSPHAKPAQRDFLSISGSPDELAARSERLAAHVCETIEAGADCKLPAIASLAASELRGLQDSYMDDQQALHRILTGPDFDAGTWQVAGDAQLERLRAGSRRYLQFLAEVSSALTPEQKQRFAH